MQSRDNSSIENWRSRTSEIIALDVFRRTDMGRRKWNTKIIWCGVLKTAHSLILVINQLNVKFLFYTSLLYASTCFEHYVLIIRRSKLYYTSSGIIKPVGGRPVHRLREDCSAVLSQPEPACASIRPPWTTRIPLDGFSWIWYLSIFRKYVQKILSFVKIGQE